VTAPDPTNGLSTAQAKHRLARHGPNSLPSQPPRPLWLRWLKQFQSPLIYILLGALVVELVVWSGSGPDALPFEAAAIAIILVLNAALGVWQERKAEEALAKLRTMAAPQVWAYRDGEWTRIPSATLVPGDLVRLEAGDRVPADGISRRSHNLMIDESVLTGESLPVAKIDSEEVMAGTLVARGTTTMSVVRTGPDSALGRLATLIGQVRQEPTPLERRLRHFGHQVAAVILVLAVVIAAGGIAVEGLARTPHILLFAVALAVAAVPEGLPAVLTFSLSLGVERMARRHAVVRRLAAVEALGSVTVIATDKTGTLTENRMEVRVLDSLDHDRALRAMILANDAEPDSAAGDPLEIALLDYATTRQVKPRAIRTAFPRRSVRAFDSATKYMRVTVVEDGRETSYLKGAPEILLDRAELSAQHRREWAEKIRAYASQGYRLLALATGAGQREVGLEWLGLVLLWDPPRPEVPDAVRAARSAGIRIIMVTGDHPETALTVARSVGIEADTVVTGSELASASPEELRSRVQEANVFARVDPVHKLRIVEALKAEGAIVAMTGDGVNDAPALKRADIGVAMGIRGSDVAREVADLILLDDNFATIVAAIEEGRSIYENIKKFIRFLFSTNLSEVLVVSLGAAAAVLIGLRDSGGELLLPLTAAQLLWINLVTDGAPALALGVDKNPGVMHRPPADPSAPLLDRDSLRFILSTAGLKAAVAFAILGLMPRLLDAPLEFVRTAVFLFLAAGQLLFAYPARHTDVRPMPNPTLHMAIALGFIVQLAIVFIHPVGQAFDTVPLTAAAWGWVAGAIVISWGLAELTGRLIWVRRTWAKSSP
jgi:Ca2+-transporting ATPase